MSEAPPFWFQKPGIAAWALSPIGAIYGAITAKRMQKTDGVVTKTPVLCIGNFITGGAGKTPTAIAIAKIARELGLRPGFLSRGYGGSITKPTIVDIKAHNAKDVGDEPLILGLYAVTVISPNRPAGAALLEEQGIDIILMDDGFQNPSLHKDYSLAVVDASRGIGNGFCMPAGPMRAPLRPQLALASAILLIGKSEAGTRVVRKAAKMAKPILEAEIIARRADDWTGQRVLAYAGIADPSKFYASLEAVGAEVVERRNFHDHHPYSAEECHDLLTRAKSEKLTLVTTEKDSVRLIRMGEGQQELRTASKVLNVDLKFENPKMVEVIIRDTIKRAAEFRISKKN
ncbi:MAG: tetraacyldisaccharide 4'-kinase [Rhizobiaceae bacterium]